MRTAFAFALGLAAILTAPVSAKSNSGFASISTLGDLTSWHEMIANRVLGL